MLNSFVWQRSRKQWEVKCKRSATHFETSSLRNTTAMSSSGSRHDRKQLENAYHINSVEAVLPRVILRFGWRLVRQSLSRCGWRVVRQCCHVMDRAVRCSTQVAKLDHFKVHDIGSYSFGKKHRFGRTSLLATWNLCHVLDFDSLAIDGEPVKVNNVTWPRSTVGLPKKLLPKRVRTVLSLNEVQLGNLPGTTVFRMRRNQMKKLTDHCNFRNRMRPVLFNVRKEKTSLRIVRIHTLEKSTRSTVTPASDHDEFSTRTLVWQEEPRQCRKTNNYFNKRGHQNGVRKYKTE